MSLINEHNCEAWFLDYHEGNLNPYQTKLLFDFLKDNPQFVEIFNQYENFKLNPQKTIFNVLTLYKQLPHDLSDEISGSDYAAIAYAEGILKNDEKKHIDKFIDEDKSFKELVNIYQKLKLSPDTTIVFKGKQSLKRPWGISMFHYGKLYKYAVAAALLIFILVNVWLFMPKNSSIQLAELKAARKRPYVERALKPEINSTLKIENASKNKQKVNISVKNRNTYDVQTLNNGDSLIDNLHENSLNENISSPITQTIITDKNENIDKTSEKNIVFEKNNVKTSNNEIFLSPSELIVSKFLNNSIYELSDKDVQKKSRYWQLLELAAQKYSDKSGKKFKIKKTYNEGNNITYALITEKFEISHTSSKN